MNTLLAWLEHSGKRLVWGVPMAWLLCFFLFPFFIVINFSFSSMDGVYVRDLSHWANQTLTIAIRLSNYFFIFSDSLYLSTYINSLGYAFITTVLCLLIGYPFAYFMARADETIRPALLMMVMLPFWTSLLLRAYAWKGLLTTNGLVNQWLLSWGLITEPLHMLHTSFSLTLGMVYAYLPFMILPLYANLVKLDERLLEAAYDLGATPWQAFWRVTVPVSKSGIVAGALLVFIPCVGEYVIPELLGGPETLMIGKVLWDEFFGNNDWPMASAVAVVLTLSIVVPMVIFNRQRSQEHSA